VLLGGRRLVQKCVRAGTEQREQGVGIADVLPLDVASERVGVEHVAHDGVADGLRVEPEEVVSAQHAQVGAQLALVVEDRGVAALAGGEPLYVVGHLTLKEVGRLPAADREHRPRPLQQPRRLGDELVLARGDHEPIVRMDECTIFSPV
jgi:hypothetical protein